MRHRSCAGNRHALAIASFVAFQEGLISWSSGPLTEPLLLLLLYLSVLLAVRQRAWKDAFWIGLALGIATTIRLETVVAAAGLGLLMAGRAPSNGPRWPHSLKSVGLFAAGFTLIDTQII